MRILLIRPRPHKETIGLQKVMICEPLELEYIGAYMKSYGHEIFIIDMILEKKPISYFINKYNPEIVGITSYIAHVNIVKGYSREIKKINPNCKIIVGGVHAEVVPQDFISPNIDFIIKANGLDTFKEIVEALSNNKTTDSIKGVYGNNIYCKKNTSFHFPHPDRSLVDKYRKKYYYMFHNPCSLIKTSYGCPYNCSFCFCRKITDDKYFYRELDDIILELKSIKEEEIYIVDDDFIVDKERILKFCKLLKEENINKKFLIYGRADFIAENEDVIKEFKKNGLRAVIVGLESGNEEELKKYNKKSSVKTNEEAIKILRENSVEAYGTFVLGVDWDKNDFKNLYIWIKKLKLKFINLQPFTPLPGTELFLEYKDKLIIQTKEYEKWDLAHLVVKPTKISVSSYYFNMLIIYYKITMNPKNVYKMIKDYGLKENIKLSIGATSITFQYIKKIIKGI